MRIFLWEISPRIEANQITAEIIAMLGWNCQYLTKIKAHNHMNQLSLVQIVKIIGMQTETRTTPIL